LYPFCISQNIGIDVGVDQDVAIWANAGGARPEPSLSWMASGAAPATTNV